MRACRARLAIAMCVLVPNLASAQESPQIFGYFSTRLEKSLQVPTADGSNVVKESQPKEFAQPFFNLMVQHQFDPRFKAFINLNGAGAGTIDVRNLWGEWTPSNAFNVRIGKFYRKFGLYNEVLDAVPTYYGIEPPEAFDGDHLLISRTSTAMVYGFVRAGSGKLNYSLSTDNGEGRDIEGTFPVGGDVNYNFGRGSYTIGISGYSSGGATNSDRAVGNGSPKSGVLPWMARDSFTVVNTYAEAKTGSLTLQAEWARADHKSQRDAAAVVSVVNGAGINAAQRARFLVNPAGAVNAANVRLSGDHVIQTWYVRAGYSKETSVGEFGPYLQWDGYKNPETIATKKFGGDDEAGVADDGAFSKATAGILFRPVPQVAFKFDASLHRYRFLGRRVSYPEIRLDLSYAFGL
jgi:hypothetical protein